jgi:8-oxo-dGTP pyrophosphatase MutT (NUDIX family)
MTDTDTDCVHQPAPTDNQAYRFPVSVKGVIFRGGKVILLRNGRDEWELPGGKLEPRETPPICVVREVREELGLAVRVGPILDSWVYHIGQDVDVLIVTYGCFADPHGPIRHSTEHKAAGLFSMEDIIRLNMPEGYKNSIRSWSTSLATDGRQPTAAGSCGRSDFGGNDHAPDSQ